MKLVGDDTVTVSITGKQIAVGKSDNSYDLVWGSTNSANYSVVPVIGELVVENRGNEKYVVKGETDDVTITYDGNVHKDFDFRLVPETGVLENILNSVSNMFSFTSGAMDASTETAVTVDGVNYKVTGVKVTTAEKNVGKYDLTIDFSGVNVQDPYGNDVTGQFDISEQSKTGVLTINPAEVTVSVRKDYTKTSGARDPEFTATVTAEDSNLQTEAVETVTKDTYKISRDKGEKVGTTYPVHVTGPEYLGNFHITYEDGSIRITGSTPTPTPGGSTPTPIDDDPTPTAPTPTPTGEVLGARREDAPADGAAVLGARRGRTEDETNSASRVFAILVSAAAAVAIMLKGRKKEEEE